MKIMASVPITLWQIEGHKVETVTDFILGGSKITVGSDCSCRIQRCLLLGRKAMTDLDSILKSRDFVLPTKIHIVKAVVFPGIMYRCESWIVKKAEYLKSDAFKLWYLRRHHWEGNRQEGQGSPNGGKRLQVPDIFISLKWQEEKPSICFSFSIQI